MLASVISSSAGSVVGTIRCLADIAPAAPTAIAPAIPTTASPTIRPMTVMAFLLDARPRPTAAGDKSSRGAGERERPSNGNGRSLRLREPDGTWSARQRQQMLGFEAQEVARSRKVERHLTIHER